MPFMLSIQPHIPFAALANEMSMSLRLWPVSGTQVAGTAPRKEMPVDVPYGSDQVMS